MFLAAFPATFRRRLRGGEENEGVRLNWELLHDGNFSASIMLFEVLIGLTFSLLTFIGSWDDDGVQESVGVDDGALSSAEDGENGS